MEQKVLYYSDELNDELAPATIQSRVIDEKFKYKKGLIWNVCSLFIQNVLSMPIKWGYLRIKFRHKFIGKEKLNEKENTEIMKQKNFETWKNVYEKFYGIPLEYTCEKNNNK